MTASPTFYATIDADSVRPYIPSVPIMLPASSFARHRLRAPKLHSGLDDIAVDCGGFVATFRWGDYRYTPAEYVDFCRGVRPRWAATMDYCCEPEITAEQSGLVLSRQDRTTEQAWRFWLTYRDEPWVWVPTVQGWSVDDYRRHARDLQPLVRAMRDHYGAESAFRVGIGTLCRRASVGLIRDVVQAVREQLPDVGLHLWGVKLTLLKQGTPPSVVSFDTAAWNGMFGQDLRQRQESKLTQREYAYLEALPSYGRKIRSALTRSRTLPMLSSAGAA